VTFSDGVLVRFVEQAQVEITIVEPLLEVPRIRREQPQLDAGVVAGERGHQRLGQQVGRALQQPDRDDARDDTRLRSQFGTGPVDLGQRAPGAFGEADSGGGRPHSLPGAFEQLDAELLLQRADLPCHGGLDQVQQLGRPRDAADLDDRHQRLELFEVHRGPA
jgi:hypothetical protein